LRLASLKSVFHLLRLAVIKGTLGDFDVFFVVIYSDGSRARDAEMEI